MFRQIRRKHCGLHNYLIFSTGKMRRPQDHNLKSHIKNVSCSFPTNGRDAKLATTWESSPGLGILAGILPPAWGFCVLKESRTATRCQLC